MSKTKKVIVLFNYNATEFREHMTAKLTYWRPSTAHFGEDFCVFKFWSESERDNAIHGAAYWVDSYDYKLVRDTNCSFVIINKTKSKEVKNDK